MFAVHFEQSGVQAYALGLVSLLHAGFGQQLQHTGALAVPLRWGSSLTAIAAADTAAPAASHGRGVPFWALLCRARTSQATCRSISLARRNRNASLQIVQQPPLLLSNTGDYFHSLHHVVPLRYNSDPARRRF